MKHIEFLEQLIGPFANEGGGGGDEPTGSVTLTANGTYNVKTKAQAVVAVPPYGEGSVNINSNGTHNVSGKAQAVVAVPGPSGSMNITENGTYDVTDKAEAVVNVSGGGGGSLNDFAYEMFNLVVTELADSTDPNVPRVTQLPEYMTRGLTSLVSIDYPNVTLIGAYNLYGNPNLKTARFAGCLETKSSVLIGASGLETLYMPSLKTMVGGFTTLSKLKSVNLDSLEALPNSAFAAAQSSGHNVDLTELSLPAIKTIGTSCGQYFQGLNKLTFGSSVTSIGSAAFRYCTELDTIIFGANTPAVPTLGSNAFAGSAMASGNGYIYVPDALVNDWKAASNWSTYANQIKGLSELPS